MGQGVVDNPAPKKVSEILNEAWVHFYVMGMPYAEYWFDDPHKVDFYIKAEKLRQKKENEKLWLQGLYFYIAMQRSLNNLFAKKGATPEKYLEKPLPTDESEVVEIENNTSNDRLLKLKSDLMKRARKKTNGLPTRQTNNKH